MAKYFANNSLAKNISQIYLPFLSLTFGESALSLKLKPNSKCGSKTENAFQSQPIGHNIFAFLHSIPQKFSDFVLKIIKKLANSEVKCG